MKIDESALFYTCSLLELMGRTSRQKRGTLAGLMGQKIISHIYSHADVLHCEPIAQTAEIFIEMCHIEPGDFDNAGACKYHVPDYWDIGKVYARLIADVAQKDVIDTLIHVYQSPASDAISNFNSDFFYQPRDFIREFYLQSSLRTVGS